MKRYTKLKTIIPHHSGSDYVIENRMVLRSDGEWVRYGDVEAETSRITEIYEKRILELKVRKQDEPLYHGDDRIFIDGYPAFITPGGKIYSVERPECNCREQWKFVISWICPAHGYKKR